MTTTELRTLDAEVLAVFRDHAAGSPPTLDEVAGKIVMSHRSVQYAVKRLLGLGLLRYRAHRGPKQWRAIEATPIGDEPQQPFDVAACRTHCRLAMLNTHTGKWLEAALNEIDRLRRTAKEF